MTMECRSALPLIVPAMAGLTILAKGTRAGATGGSAFWKEPGEETPTFLGTVRRMSLGPVFMRVAMAGSAQSNI
jgi:hypothetical protein